MINCHRMHPFDVVKQYRAIFSDDTSGSEEHYDGGRLFSWAMHQITSHLKTLKIMLGNITDGGSLSNILDQRMYCAVGLNRVGLDFRGLLPSLFEVVVLNIFSKHLGTEVGNFQFWSPIVGSHYPAVGFHSSSTGEENQDDVTPPSYLMEHPHLAEFINGVSAAMNELRPCAPTRLKTVLAKEVINALQAVFESLLRYNATRMVRETESGLFLSLCRSFIEVAYPYCATCFNSCYPWAATFITDAKSLYDGLGRLLSTSPSRQLPKPANGIEGYKVKGIEGYKVKENRDVHIAEKEVSSDVEHKDMVSADEKETSPSQQMEENTAIA